MGKFLTGHKVRYKGEDWTVHSVIESEDIQGRNYYWIIRHGGKYDDDIRIVFETEIEGIWENWGNCCCGAETVGHPAHAYYCNKFRK